MVQTQEHGDTAIQVTPSQLREAIIALYKANQPGFVWGQPGCGKSAIFKQVADELGIGFIDLRLSQLDPVDLRGLPHVNGDNQTHWCVPSFFPKDGEGIFFCDELNLASQSMMAAGYQLIHDRRVGDSILPPGWVPFGAGNRETDKCGVTRMPWALRTRFRHLELVTDVDDWVGWALNNGVGTSSIAFIRFRPDLLCQFDPTTNDKTHPNPRTHVAADKLLQADLPESIQYQMIAGTVGEGCAAERLAFEKLCRSLPSRDAVILNPDSVEVPTDPATLYAICGSLASAADDVTFEPILKYAKRMPPEFQVLLVKDSVRRDESLKHSRCFIDWAVSNKEILI